MHEAAQNGLVTLLVLGASDEEQMTFAKCSLSASGCERCWSCSHEPASSHEVARTGGCTKVPLRRTRASKQSDLLRTWEIGFPGVVEETAKRRSLVRLFDLSHAGHVRYGAEEVRT